MCCHFSFCLFSVILTLCLAQDWNSFQPELSTSPVGQEDWNRPGTTIAGGGFLVDNSQPGDLTFFNDNPSANNAPDTTGFGSLRTSNDPLSVHDVNAIAFASNSPQTLNSDNHQQQIGESKFLSTDASTADSSEAGRVLGSSNNLAQFYQPVQRDPQQDLALIGDDSPIPSVPFLDILNNAIQGNPSMNDPVRTIEPIHDPEERLTNPEKPDCKDGKFAFCCNLGFSDGATMKGVPLAERVHKRRLCTRCMCTFPRLPRLFSRFHVKVLVKKGWWRKQLY